MNPEPHFEVPPVFSLAGVKPSQIPPDDVLMQAAQVMLTASTSWPARKSYQNVKTFVERGDGSKKSAQNWHCVVSEFRRDQVPFSRIWAKLGRNQVQHQQSHLSGLMKVARVKYISELQSIWTTLFTASPPLSPRVYTIYQTSWLLEYSHKQRGIIVTLPVDMSSRERHEFTELEEMGIKGRYVSIEHLQEMDGDVIEWRKVSCRDPGGMIPKFWVQRQMGRNMAQENIAFMTWMSKIVNHEEASPDEEDEYSEGARNNIESASYP